MTTAAIRRLAVPSPDELVDRARAMVPEIRALAEETEKNRKISPHIIAKFREAELLRTCRPKEFGGFEYDGETALRIALTISAACASTGWAVNGAVSNGRSMSHFPIETQREIWSTDADPFSCACFLLPIKDCEIIDNWFVNGLAGTGSKDIAVNDVFVPERRILMFSDARAGTTPGAKYHQNPIYRMPLLINGASMLASTAVGAARGALDAYLEMINSGRKTRGALAGGQLPMAEFATVQLRYAEAAASVEAAELILLTDMRTMTAKLYAGEEITVADRIRCRRNQAYVTKLAVQAVEALNAATGGYGLLLSNPVQRAWRDANAVARHVSLNWDAVGTMYGQHAFGLEPKGQY